MSRILATVGVLAAALSMAACEASKSSDPLSSERRRPDSGVEISAPKMLEPGPGSKISIEKQPVTLADRERRQQRTAAADLLVRHRDRHDLQQQSVLARRHPARRGRPHCSLRMIDTLATGHTYYWRVRAQDGANTGPYATPMAFDIFTPIVDRACPGLTAPAPNSTVLVLRPTFTLADAPKSGPTGTITYLIELADSDSFANKVATWTAAETPNQTNMVSPADLTYGKVYYWHARAYDPTTLGPWSYTQAFQMLAEPAPVFAPGPGAERTRRPTTPST